MTHPDRDQQSPDQPEPDQHDQPVLRAGGVEDDSASEELLADLAAEHRALVDELASELDLDTGVALALAPGAHRALVDELAGELDLDTGLSRILGPAATPRPPRESASPGTVRGAADDSIPDIVRVPNGRPPRPRTLSRRVEIAVLTNDILKLWLWVLERGEHWLLDPLAYAWRILDTPTVTRSDLVLCLDALDTQMVEDFLAAGDPQAMHLVVAITRRINRMIAKGADDEWPAAPEQAAAEYEAITRINELRVSLLTLAQLRAREGDHETAQTARRTLGDLVGLWRGIETRSIDRVHAERAADHIDEARRHLIGRWPPLARAVRRLFGDAERPADQPTPSR